jgi:hypothetical protein
MTELPTRNYQRIEDLERPALDDRSYRIITLRNDLEVLLIHDAETDKASAALDVNVGSFSDAADMPGIAHAVEHLLFMGTEKVSLVCVCVLYGWIYLIRETVPALSFVCPFLLYTERVTPTAISD